MLGGGPAGLTAGYLLARQGRPVIVLEAEDQVGGIAKTEVRDGYRFDLGGHRFFTKSKEVDDLWHEVMKEEFLKRPRMSRIYWNGKFLDYPLNGTDVIKKLGPIELVRSGLSYLWAVIKPKGEEENVEQWVSNRFGWRLYNHFFKGYTEKVWGVPTTELRAEWAAQRIKGLSFWSAAKAAFMGNGDNKIKSLINEFHYPRFGPGQMWETMCDEIIALGGEVRLNSPRRRHRGRGRPHRRRHGRRRAHRVLRRHLLAAAARDGRPGRRVLRRLGRGQGRRDGPALPRLPDGRADHRRRGPLPGQLDLHPRRLASTSAGSRTSAPGARGWSRTRRKASVGLEFFCFQGDELWEMDDDDLVELAKRELGQLGLGDPAKVEKGYVTRVPLAYPMYDADYAERVLSIRGWLETIANLQQVGRNGLHRYNNSDHSMLTSIRAVDNIVNGAGHDIWEVNAESVYHEEDVKDEHPYRRAPETKAMREPLVSAES